jgi:non-lysosomal glucosylceramidase
LTQHPTFWPILSRYEGEYLQEISFPLGGIGTGNIALGGRGELRDFELFNTPSKGFAPPNSFFALRAQAEGAAAVTRILEGVLQPSYSGGFGVNVTASGLPRMRHIHMEAAYPFARYTLSDPDLPVSVRLEAFNPLIPLDVDRSSLPVAVLRYVVVNETDTPVAVSVAGNLYNMIGVDILGQHRGATLGGRNLTGLLGGNINETRRAGANGQTLHGLLMRSQNVAARTLQDGTLALAVLAEDATWRRTWGPMHRHHWNRHLLTFWDDFSADGRFDDPEDAPPSEPGGGQVGSLAASAVVPPHGEHAFTFLLCWHFPHRTAADSGWNTLDAEGGWIGNYYTNHYADAWDVAVQVAPQLPQLEAESARFTTALVESTLPSFVKEAALNNVTTLRSPTCFRTADGHFFGFEGCADTQGCCFGSCTHVWNYEQTTAFLFPQLAQNMRRLELEEGTQADGLNFFRLRLPLGQEPWAHAAADGQMGVVMKCYREWQLSGDHDFLLRYWPTIKSLVEYCWLPGSWDADQDGVMEGMQHNTYDIEFFGPNPLSGIWYLGALAAAAEMADAAGDASFAERCRTLREQGSAWIDEHLFNGEYYIQQIQTPASLDETRPELRVGMGETDLSDPDFQLGNGCLVDQLVGQYMAHVVGLGYLLQPEKVKSALDALFRYNFRRELYNHWNTMRTYALADEGALLICSWPHGDRPRVPFPYFSEVMTGFEYQAAVHMIYEGLVDEGLAVVEAIRRRFDGHRRNPWNEQECGHHYARAMAAWAVPLALSGFHYSAVTQRLSLAPRWQPDHFQSLWTIPSGWGSVRQQRTEGEQEVTWQIHNGSLAVQQITSALPAGQQSGEVTVQLDGRTLGVQITQESDQVQIHLADPLLLTDGQRLVIRFSLDT